MRVHHFVFSSVAVIVLLFALVSACAAQTETVLYSFTLSRNDGGYPLSGLAFDGKGNLYGTTSYGGTYNGGTIFQLTPPATVGGSWTKKTIYSFTGGSGGAYPRSRLTFHNHVLYGTALLGGTCTLYPEGCGLVFQLSLNPGAGWQLTVLYTFAGGSDGAAPLSGATFDTAGNMYGTTYNGGGSTACGFDGQQAVGCGTVYELSPPAASGGNWTETLLYAFGGSADGGLPAGETILDSAGSLYGTESFGGGSGYGVVFQLSPPSMPGTPWKQSVVHAFKGGKYDGAYPVGDLVFDHSGNLFGATALGGTAASACPDGCGTVYKLVPPSTPGGAWTERLLHKFGTGKDGTVPMGGVLMDSSGNLYGTTYDGGDSTACGSSYGCGTIYKLAKPSSAGGTWNETLLYSFGGGTDGLVPNGGLLFDSNWNIYGTTVWGGDLTGACSGNGCGAVFEITQ